MIIAWMCAALLFAACVSAAAYTTARLVQWANRPTRLVWSAALAIAVCWPLLVPLLRAVPWPEAAATVEAIGATVGVERVALVAPAAPSAVERALQFLAPFGWWMLGAWAVMSALLFARLLLAAFRLRQLTRSASPAEVDGEPVLLAEWLGPASVGWREPRVVLPRWVLTLDAPLRAMVLRHEREHCRTGDPRVVWYAAIATALVPWNPAVWWLARQLRLALELDCDARTLARGGDAHRYAKLLLFMSQQHAVPAARTTLALSLSRSSSQLSQRILAMQQQMQPHRRHASRSTRFALTVASLIAAVGACNTDIPGTVTLPEDEVVVTESAEEAAASVAGEPEVVSISEVAQDPSTRSLTDAPTTDTVVETEQDAKVLTVREVQLDQAAAVIGSIATAYPPLLRSAQVEGSVLASFVVDVDGTVDMSTYKVTRSDHALFTNSVRQGLEKASFTPATKNGRAVRSRVTLPFAFSLGRRTVEKIAEGGGSAVMISDAASARSRPNPVPAPGEPYFEFQVDEPAKMTPGTNTMQYPTTLREDGVEGAVLVSFVLNTNGTADMSTFRVVRSDHDLFVESVKAALPAIRYVPGKVRGEAVKQVVQQPFVFRLAR